MINKKYLNLAVILLISACTINAPSINPVPSSTPSPKLSASSLPVASNSPQSSATPLPKVDDTGKLVLQGKGFIRTPDTAFLSNEKFDLLTELSFGSLKPETQTIFSLYDANALPVKTHYLLSINNNNLVLKINTASEIMEKTINIDDLKTDIFYKLRFLIEAKKVSLFLSEKEIFSTELKDRPFQDKNGTRTLSFGGDQEGKNFLSAKIDYLQIGETISYSFNQNLNDQGVFGINAEGLGDFLLGNLPPEIVPTPSVTPSPTPLPSPAKQLINNTEIILGVKKRESDVIGLETFTSKGFSLGENKLVDDFGDIRFVSDIIRNETFKIRLSGNEKVFVVDLGERNFDGVDLEFIKNKVDFDRQINFYSQSNRSSQLYLNHLYAIKSLRYGEIPLYGKLLLKDIRFFAEVFVDLKSPKVNSQPAYQLAGRTTSLPNNTTFDYYLSTYDGSGETSPIQLTQLPADPIASSKKVEFSFVVPYGATGYNVYRVHNGNNIYKLGPFPAASKETVTFSDSGITGSTLSSLPNKNTTDKSGFEPEYDDLPEAVSFKYKFYGDGKEF